MVTTPTSMIKRLTGEEASPDPVSHTGAVSLSGNALATGPAAGITGGSGTICKTSVQLVGGIYTTRIFLDVTGLGTSTTDLDIVGTGSSAAYLCRITAAECGTIIAGRMTCFVVPTTGADDLDLYYATEATGKFDDAVTGLTETAVITAGGAWTAALTKAFTGLPAANSYLYLCNGEAGTVGTFAAGQFLIELFGY
jgi:hypothetical protein